MSRPPGSDMRQTCSLHPCARFEAQNYGFRGGLDSGGPIDPMERCFQWKAVQLFLKRYLECVRLIGCPKNLKGREVCFVGVPPFLHAFVLPAPPLSVGHYSNTPTYPATKLNILAFSGN
jgi:hypothetical protein